MNRRELLWLATLASTSPVLSRKGLRARFPKAFWDDPQSPPTTPFVRPLPFPAPPKLAAPFYQAVAMTRDIASVPDPYRHLGPDFHVRARTPDDARCHNEVIA